MVMVRIARVLKFPNPLEHRSVKIVIIPLATGTTETIAVKIM